MQERSPRRGWLFLAAFLGCLAIAALPAFAALPLDPGAVAVQKVFQWRPFLAPFHAVVLHFPIGFVTMAFILEILYRMRRPRPELTGVITLTLWLSLLSGLLAAGFGILRATGGGYETHAVESHRWMGLAVVAFTLATLAMHHFSSGDETHRVRTFCYRGLLAATLSLVVVAGHEGGNLTHGANYLTENAPPFVREFLEDQTPAATAGITSASLDEAQRFFVERVQPILNHKCIRCHGPEKQKGDYRLDQPEVAFKGGESGLVAINPAKPLESELVRLISLPPGNDEIMPPEGKEPVTADEMLTVIRWIQMGAAFPPAAPPLAAQAGVR